MAAFTERALGLVKKALAIAVLVIERQPRPFPSLSGQADMKALLDGPIDGDAALAHHLRAHRRDRRAG